LDGPALQKRLSELGSTMPIIFLTGYADTPTVVRTVKAGAHDFLTKPVQGDELLRTLEKALADQQAWRDQQSALDSIRARLATLSPRERQVFELVIRGKLNKQIAHTLGTAARTIKAHRSKVMEKMQVQSLAELVSLAERVGVLNGPTEPTDDLKGQHRAQRHHQIRDTIDATPRAASAQIRTLIHQN
jgi:FixJ family two-component response regulator